MPAGAHAAAHPSGPPVLRADGEGVGELCVSTPPPRHGLGALAVLLVIGLVAAGSVPSFGLPSAGRWRRRAPPPGGGDLLQNLCVSRT